jgi:Asp-tRNA(Asn)/Glu-tRNA(Gln) amidotransferase A subunit family amidase
VQLIGAPFQEGKLLRVAYDLERTGTISAPVAEAFRNTLAEMGR